MEDEERSINFAKAEKDIIKALQLVTSDSIKDTIKLLDTAKNDIEIILKGSPTEWQVWHLTNIKSEINAVLNQLKTKLASLGATSTSAAWNGGLNMIDKPLSAAGMINVVQSLPLIDINRIGTNRAFLLDRLTDIPSAIVGKINAQLGAVSIGATTRHEAIQNIGKLLTKGGRSRARTILGTELGRMAEIASHERRKVAQKRLPGMKKEWRKSGKKNPRHNHANIHGQIQKINDPFILAGGVKLDYPKDPKAPAKETINCGCYTRTRMDSWEVKKL